MKKRCIDDYGNIVEHVAEYCEVVNTVQNFLIRLERDSIHKADILAALHLITSEAERFWRFRSEPVEPVEPVVKDQLCTE